MYTVDNIRYEKVKVFEAKFQKFYHLIHHLYPEVPFYKMHKVWFLKYDEINRHNLSLQTAFGLVPSNIEAHRNFDHSKFSPQV